MASSSLDHLKNAYRRRFCLPSRAPKINVEQGQDILEILQDCFEEKSLASDFSADSIKSTSHSTPKKKDSCLQSTNRECQKSHPESLPVSSRKKEDSFQIKEPNKDVSKSVHTHEVYQKIPTNDGVGFENPYDSEHVSGGEQDDHHSESDEEFYLSIGSSFVLLDEKISSSKNANPSKTPRRKTYTSENSVNMLSSSKKSSLKTKKRLNFEDDNISKNIEIEDKVSEGPRRKSSGTSQKRTQASDYEMQSQARKSFSALFLESVKRKTESSSVVRHAPLHSSSPNDVNLLGDEFIIDESEKSLASQSWIKIPGKVNLIRAVSPVESIVVPQGRKSRGLLHHVEVETLTNDKAHPVKDTLPSKGKKLEPLCSSADEMEYNCKSTQDAVFSENTAKSSGNKRTIKQPKRKVKANVVEEQLEREQPNDKNINKLLAAQHKSQRNSDQNMEVGEEMRNDPTSKKQIKYVGKKKSIIHVPNKENQNKVKETFKNKCVSKGPNQERRSEEVNVTVTKSQRISRKPSKWWEVTPEYSPVNSNELSLHHESGNKAANKINQSSKNIGTATTFLTRQKTATQGSSRASFSNDKVSGAIDYDKSLQSNKEDVAKKKNVDHSGALESSQGHDSSNIHLKCQTSEYTWKTGTYFEKLKTSILERSGPSRTRKYIMSGKSNSDKGRKEAKKRAVLPSSSPNVRRTKRIRMRPLEYWRGERIDYQARLSGGFVVGGILSPDTMPHKGKKANGDRGQFKEIINTKRICLANDERKNNLVANLNVPLGDPFQPTRVKDPETDASILMDLIRPRDTCQFFVDHEELKVYKTLDTPYFSTGKLVLGPCQEKGMQFVGLDTLVFFVYSGDLLCTLHETPYLMSTGDSFYVPSGNYYNIINLLNEDSVLLFTQIKS
ncbi:centromere protein C [Echinops telfairi]|uniref:Centromere protein C n=1 Tax=Echinops telfairi TaxID=9371 RepID=A0AC55CMB4_ECHTE|nr:centromere protein C [Echinops telfairi]